MAERRPRKAVSRKATTQTVQAAVEGVPVDDGKVEFMGQPFKTAEKIGLWPLIAFSMAQKRGDNVDPAAMATIGEMVLDCLDESEHARFARHATEAKAGAEELMKLVQQVIEVVSARPSGPPGSSSAGQPTTSPNSKGPLSIEGMVSPEDLAR